MVSIAQVLQRRDVEIVRTDRITGTKHPSYQAYQILHWGFAALPIIAGAPRDLVGTTRLPLPL